MMQVHALLAVVDYSLSLPALAGWSASLQPSHRFLQLMCAAHNSLVAGASDEQRRRIDAALRAVVKDELRRRQRR